MTVIKNIGVSQSNVMPEFWKGIILTPQNMSDTIANLGNANEWQDKIVAAYGSRAYLFPLAVDGESMDQEDVMQTTSIGVQLYVRPGMYGQKFKFNVSLEVYKQLYSFHNTNWRAFIIDTEDNLCFTSSDNVNGRGFLSQIFVPKLERNDGSNKTLAPLHLNIMNPSELNANGKVISASFLSDLIQLTTVDLVASNASATALTVKVTNPNDGTPILGLVKADFVALTGAGASQTTAIDTVADATSTGTYVFACTGLVAGSVNLVVPSALTIKAYESSGAASFTIA